MTNSSFATQALAISLAAIPLCSVRAATYMPVRSSIDTVIGDRQVNGPALGYYAGSGDTLVGASGSNVTSERFDQDLIYRYSLPTFGVGETVDSFTFDFQITAMRDHAQEDFRLDVYLLDIADPTTSGSSLYLRADNDPSHELLGDFFFDDGGNNGSISGLSEDVSFTINSVTNSAALNLLQGFYGGDHIPDQAEVAFRFNLDRDYSGGDLGNSALNRYYVNDDSATSGLTIDTIPEPSAMLIGLAGSILLLRRRR